jgi:hypothetical protein
MPIHQICKYRLPNTGPTSSTPGQIYSGIPGVPKAAQVREGARERERGERVSDKYRDMMKRDINPSYIHLERER